MKYKKTTSIRVSNELLSKLRGMGAMGETYEDVIWKIMRRKNERQLC